MKLGINPEYIINLSNSFMSYTGANSQTRNFGLSGQWHYAAQLFVAPYNMSVNRVAFPVVTSNVSLLTAGITTVDSFGLPNGQTSGTSLTFLSSAGISSTTNGQYAVVTIPDVTLTQNNPYFVAVQVKTFTSTVNIRNSTINGTHAQLVDFPYIVERSTSTVKVGFLPEFCWGFNNGVETQWYGMPNGGSTQTNGLGSNGLAYHFIGARINIPSNFTNFAIKSVCLDLQKNPSHNILCRIYESDKVTQVVNATSTIFAYPSANGSRGIHCFHFGQYPILKAFTTYYVEFFAYGALAANTTFFSQRTNGPSLTTSAIINSEFHTAYDITNRYYWKATSTGSAVYTEYDNARLNMWFICENFSSSTRSNKPNGYNPGF